MPDRRAAAGVELHVARVHELRDGWFDAADPGSSMIAGTMEQGHVSIAGTALTCPSEEIIGTVEGVRGAASGGGDAVTEGWSRYESAVARIVDFLRAPAGPRVRVGRVDMDEAVQRWRAGTALSAAAAVPPRSDGIRAKPVPWWRRLGRRRA
jgi:hypothetical protein